MIEEHDVVCLVRDLPEHGLRRGQLGAVVHVFGTPAGGYQVEFVDGEGDTLALIPLRDADIEVVPATVPV